MLSAICLSAFSRSVFASRALFSAPCSMLTLRLLRNESRSARGFIVAVLPRDESALMVFPISSLMLSLVLDGFSGIDLDTSSILVGICSSIGLMVFIWYDRCSICSMMVLLERTPRSSSACSFVIAILAMMSAGVD